MKYKVINSTHHLLIKISGDTIKNEALFVKRQLFPYLRKIGIMVIIDLSGLEEFEPAVILGVLYGIKKEVYPGHGAIPKKPEEDMQTAILNAEQLLKDEMTVEIVREMLPAEL